MNRSHDPAHTQDVEDQESTGILSCSQLPLMEIQENGEG